MLDLSRLNPPQREAVLCTEGPLLVLAGAGSGKTRVLTHRIAHLIEKGVPAWSILAITFTNKAARQMRERALSLSGASADEAWVMTFHACCARILRRDIEKLGYKRSFSIYDGDDQKSLIRRILSELNLDEKLYPVQLVRAAISDAKNKLMTPDEWLDSAGGDFKAKKIAEAYKLYEKKLRTAARWTLTTCSSRRWCCSRRTRRCLSIIAGNSVTYWWTSTRTPTAPSTN